jgi:hypothetical protein
MGSTASRTALAAATGLVLTITGCAASSGDFAAHGIVDSTLPGIKVGVR